MESRDVPNEAELSHVRLTVVGPGLPIMLTLRGCEGGSVRERI